MTKIRQLEFVHVEQVFRLNFFNSARLFASPPPPPPPHPKLNNLTISLRFRDNLIRNVKQSPLIAFIRSTAGTVRVVMNSGYAHIVSQIPVSIVGGYFYGNIQTE